MYERRGVSVTSNLRLSYNPDDTARPRATSLRTSGSYRNCRLARRPRPRPRLPSGDEGSFARALSIFHISRDNFSVRIYRLPFSPVEAIAERRKREGGREGERARKKDNRKRRIDRVSTAPKKGRRRKRQRGKETMSARKKNGIGVVACKREGERSRAEKRETNEKLVPSSLSTCAAAISYRETRRYICVFL